MIMQDERNVPGGANCQHHSTWRMARAHAGAYYPGASVRFSDKRANESCYSDSGGNDDDEDDWASRVRARSESDADSDELQSWRDASASARDIGLSTNVRRGRCSICARKLRTSFGRCTVENCTNGVCMRCLRDKHTSGCVADLASERASRAMRSPAAFVCGAVLCRAHAQRCTNCERYACARHLLGVIRGLSCGP